MKFIIKNVLIAILIAFIVFGFITMLGKREDLTNTYMAWSFVLASINALLIMAIHLVNNHKKNYRRYDHRLKKSTFYIIIGALIILSIVLAIILKAYLSIVFICLLIVSSYFTRYIKYLLALSFVGFTYSIIFNIGILNLNNNFLSLAMFLTGLYVSTKLNVENIKVIADDRY